MAWNRQGRPDGSAGSPLSRGRSLYVVSPSLQLRIALANALLTQYRVRIFHDEPQVTEAMRRSVPALVIVDEATPPHGGAALIQRLRQSPEVRAVPVLGVAHTIQSRFAAFLQAAGISFLTPCAEANTVLRMVTREIEYTFEKTWTSIEPIQRTALNDTVNLFRDISDGVLKGEPIPYTQVKSSCASLIEAVKNKNFYQLLSSVKGHDNYSYVHSVRVATFLSHFGHELGLRDDDLLTLATGGLLHDIGKAAIPLQILNKPGQLDPAEWSVMQTHVTRGLAMIDCVENVSSGVMTIAAQHHEKLDGTGYPNGLSGRELKELVRLATVVDVFSALTDQRVYKAPLAPDAALDLMRQMDAHLDQRLVKVFQEVLMSTASLMRAV